MKKTYCIIIRFLLSRKKYTDTPAKTREIADAAGLTIYQARQQMEYLYHSGVVERVTSGRGRAALWRLSG